MNVSVKTDILMLINNFNLFNPLVHKTESTCNNNLVGDAVHCITIFTINELNS